MHTPLVLYLVLSTLLTWIMIVTASTLRTKLWTFDGALLAFGNRDALPEPLAMAARADRAAKNMMENQLLFACAAIAVIGAGTSDHVGAGLGAMIYFAARVAYFPLYVAGIRYLRSATWAVGVVGIAIVALQAI